MNPRKRALKRLVQLWRNGSNLSVHELELLRKIGIAPPEIEIEEIEIVEVAPPIVEDKPVVEMQEPVAITVKDLSEDKKPKPTPAKKETKTTKTKKKVEKE